MQRSLAIALRACANAKQSLDRLYRDSPAATSSPASTTERSLFPYPTSYASLQRSGQQTSFHYIRPEAPTPSYLIFYAESQDGDLFIKFTRSYSKAAHEHSARQSQAPRLYGFETIPGGWFMVVMERLKEYEHFRMELRPSATVATRIKACLATLHDAGMVHGDFRGANVLISKRDCSVKLVDFDWSGEVGAARYPSNLNRAPDLHRPDRARNGALLQPSDDIWMLEVMLGERIPMDVAGS